MLDLDHRGGGARLLNWNTFETIKPDEFDRERVVVLVHGFTANGHYMRECASLFSGAAFNPIIANYDSYVGIQAAAEALDGLILAYEQNAGKRQSIIFVGHSMGGLVARHIALRRWSRAAPVGGVAMLGTPNNGTLDRNLFLRFLIDYGEGLSAPMPYARNVACQSALELTRQDGKGSRPFIDRLNAEWQAVSSEIPSVTIAGGRPWIEFGKGRIKNYIANKYLQRYLGQGPNDGLVRDASVQLGGTTRHENAYAEFGATNHSKLLINNTLGVNLNTWIKSLP